MQMPYFLHKFGRDLIYLSLLGCALVYFWMTEKRTEVKQKAWNTIVLKELNAATSLADYTVEASKRSLQKEHFDYPSEQSAEYYNRLLKSRYLLDTFFLKKLAQFQEGLTNSSGCFNRSISFQALKSLEKEAWLVTDSISKLVDGAAEINPIIWNCLMNREIWNNAQNATPQQTEMLFQILRFRARTMNREANGYFYNKMVGISCGDMWQPIYPYIWTDKQTPMLGEKYHAVINLSRRYRNTPNIIIRVDGKLLPNGVFSELCNTSGEQKHIIEFELRNPVTGQLEYSDKQQFNYTVIQPCN